MAADGAELARLQEALYAVRGPRGCCVVLQGMDTSGKGGVIEHVIGLVNPQGVHIHSFKKPTAEELRHHFLWRVRRALPEPGMIGIFDRSHYEDVLVVRVHALAAPEVVEKRYGEIARFEAGLADQGYAAGQVLPAHLLRRAAGAAAGPARRPGQALEVQRGRPGRAASAGPTTRRRTGSRWSAARRPRAPWYAVPADRKWYRNWAIGRLLLETVRELDPQFPRPELDVKALTKALAPPN